MARAAYTIRRKAQRQIDSAVGNIDTAMSHLMVVRNGYQADHPDIADSVNTVMLCLLKVQELTESLRKSF